MGTENKSAKTFMIVINALIWGYLVFFVIPDLIFDDEEPENLPAVETNREARGTFRPGSEKKQSDGKTWQAENAPAYFAKAGDPFDPVLKPAAKKARKSTRRQDTARRVPGYRLPGSDKPRKEPVSTPYRLSSIMKVDENLTALLTSGGGGRDGGQSLRAKKGQRLPDGSKVREINFSENYIIVVKKGHVFKLIDYSPWVLVLKKP